MPDGTSNNGLELERETLRKRIGQPVKYAAHYTSASDEWETPDPLFRELDAEFGFTLDVSATPTNAKCPRFFTLADDGLAQEWTGTCWCNPPYGSRIGLWIRKAHEASQSGATVVCLVPARTDTAWWHDYAAKAEVRFLRGRVPFVRRDGIRSRAPFPSAVLVFRPATDVAICEVCRINPAPAGAHCTECAAEDRP